MAFRNNFLVMRALLAFTVLVVTISKTNGQTGSFEGIGAGRDFAANLLKLVNNIQAKRVVVVENWTGRSVRFWCASGDDRIRNNGKTYIDLRDQQALGFSFTPNALPGFSGRTLFWCTFCYKSQRRGWNVYDQTWEKQNNGVPKNGLLRWRLIYDSVRWEYEPLKRGWDFKSWPSQGPC